jgi:hypothetical protein
MGGYVESVRVSGEGWDRSWVKWGGTGYGSRKGGRVTGEWKVVEEGRGGRRGGQNGEGSG